MILQKEIYGVDHMLDVLGLHQDTSRAKHQRGAEVLGRMVAAHFFFPATFFSEREYDGRLTIKILQ